MSKEKKRMIRAICSIFGIVVLGVICIKVYENKLIRVAKDYLSQNYSQEMKYVRVDYNWFVDPALHSVFFSPEGTSDLIFRVRISQGFNIREIRNNRRPDNYYLKYFEYSLEKNFENDVNEMWGRETSVRVMISNQWPFGSYPNGFDVPYGFDINLPLPDMAKLFGHYFIVVLIDENSRNIESKIDEASRMLKFIQTVQESGYQPESVCFKYLPKKSKDNKEQMSITFENWVDIITVGQVLEQME